MSDLLIEKPYTCPYCGEQIDTIIDTSQGSQIMIEDCSVCCRPIELSIYYDENSQTYQLAAKTGAE